MLQFGYNYDKPRKETPMAQKTEGLTYKNHPLRRVAGMIYYGPMADPYISLMHVQAT